MHPNSDVVLRIFEKTYKGEFNLSKESTIKKIVQKYSFELDRYLFQIQYDIEKISSESPIPLDVYIFLRDKYNIDSVDFAEKCVEMLSNPSTTKEKNELKWDYYREIHSIGHTYKKCNKNNESRSYKRKPPKKYNTALKKMISNNYFYSSSAFDALYKNRCITNFIATHNSSYDNIIGFSSENALISALSSLNEELLKTLSYKLYNDNYDVPDDNNDCDKEIDNFFELLKPLDISTLLLLREISSKYIPEAKNEDELYNNIDAICYLTKELCTKDIEQLKYYKEQLNKKRKHPSYFFDFVLSINYPYKPESDNNVSLIIEKLRPYFSMFYDSDLKIIIEYFSQITPLIWEIILLLSKCFKNPIGKPLLNYLAQLEKDWNNKN